MCCSLALRVSTLVNYSRGEALEGQSVESVGAGSEGTQEATGAGGGGATLQKSKSLEAEGEEEEEPEPSK